MRNERLLLLNNCIRPYVYNPLFGFFGVQSYKITASKTRIIEPKFYKP